MKGGAPPIIPHSSFIIHHSFAPSLTVGLPPHPPEPEGSSNLALARMRLVGLDDELHEAVAHDVSLVEVDELDALDLREHALDLDEAAALARRQVNLRHVARDDRLRAE